MGTLTYFYWQNISDSCHYLKPVDGYTVNAHQQDYTQDWNQVGDPFGYVANGAKGFNTFKTATSSITLPKLPSEVEIGMDPAGGLNPTQTYMRILWNNKLVYQSKLHDYDVEWHEVVQLRLKETQPIYLERLTQLSTNTSPVTASSNKSL